MGHLGSTVRARLIAGFGLVALLLALVVAAGWWGMARLQAETAEIAHERVPTQNAVSTVLTQTDAIAIALRNMMLNSDAGDRQKQQEQIAQARQLIERNIELLQTLEQSAQGRTQVQQVVTLRNQYLEKLQPLVALILADKADESRAYLADQLRPVLAQYKEALGGLASYQNTRMDATAQDAADTYAQGRTVMVGLGLLALVLAGITATFITRSLLQDLGGEPADAAELARAVAQGDFTRKVQVPTQYSKSLMASLVEMQHSLEQVVTTVRRGAESVATASAEIAQGNNDLSARTEQQASALEQTAASMEQLGSTVRQNADSARSANQLAQNASSIANQGGQVVAQVVSTMRDINDSSRRIADIISVIDGIAFQTNILALNAAVEAARAGEQGRGFAVVATEVRSLAQRSAEAAKEIKSLINASVERVEHGTNLVDQAGNTMTEVVASIQRVHDIVGEISSASQEQAVGVAQVGEAVTQMDQATQQNAALVEEMAAAASSLKGQAQELVQSVAFFKFANTGAGVALAATPARVRAPQSSAQPFAGTERRAGGIPKGAAARSGATPRPKTVSTPPVPAASTTAHGAKPKAGQDDDGWETF